MGEMQYTSKWWMEDTHEEGEYRGYTIGNLKADYIVNKNITLFGKVTNITDKRYATAAKYAYGSYSYTPGDPRSFYAGLSYKW
jgi:outer membrane receptor protein involved in Fe transport